MNLSEQYYASALLGIRLLPFRARLSIAIALRVYWQIGFVLIRHKLARGKGRVMVGKGENMLLSVRSLTDIVPLPVPAHNSCLHESLQGLAGVEPK
jgi:phytoene synthase